MGSEMYHVTAAVAEAKDSGNARIAASLIEKVAAMEGARGAAAERRV